MLNTFFARFVLLTYYLLAPFLPGFAEGRPAAAPGRPEDGIALSNTVDRPGVSAAGNLPCRLDFYFIPGCEQCRYIEDVVLSQLKELFGGRIVICKHNLFTPAEFSGARSLLDDLAVQGEDNVFCVIDGAIYVGGSKNICQDLVAIVEERLASGLPLVPPKPAPAVAHSGRLSTDRLKRASGAGWYSFPFSVFALALAGLIDGFNPCAFATIVFLVSLLLAGGGRRAGLLLTGIGFCGAVYLTYFLIGLGLFQVLRMSFMRLWLHSIVNWLLVLVLLIMAIVSFRDAWIFRRGGRQEDIILKLPGWINRLMHRVVRANLPRHYFIAGGFFLGFIVTVLESVCTGQLYAPTLLFLARSSPFKLQAMAGLALYNLMFVLPLIAVFMLACHGVNNFTFVAWTRKNVFWSKCALGAFFVFLAVVLSLT